METFSWMMEKATIEGIFRGLKLPNNGPLLSHLLFADDALLVGEWNRENVKNMARLLRCFNLVSGLSINYGKSNLFSVNVVQEEVAGVAREIGCKNGIFPCNYLGLMIRTNMNKVVSWKSVLDAFDKRLAVWKKTTLSEGGRLTLLKAVMETIPTYYFSLFKAPVKIIKQLEAKRRSFFWGVSEDKNKMCCVKWEKVTRPKEDGGLGLTPLRDTNIALLSKWWWRFKLEKNALWRKVIEAIHNNKKEYSYMPVIKSIAGAW
ncbi:hypothetical protein HanRHA438_Chr15g0710101 [Helianthus annuus]|uniref:Reverse transcriptase domain, Reverse transcriptase zinc-binding domain protein n=1 Tax=Helianthus annuus TaxID=4232 RepID=A0A9K3H4Z1_HELAN|nr:uncharacterized protein LOC110913824 [Helianthus annuus]KAF5764949.1 hypothetical protein HanXRQr2_Chr15g0697971 [Helianthus annuus]KAJ0456106.1 hypothetical protein HanIR_Chr15g0758651 [Helianthus annuus]KAJ0831665.1 hypothetical protein HanPSC8_Chr15g0669681 [Helianthus annuus]KAJ0845126.1 hypothetical protein HanRHA438_Chr15g0710101 [Helianthus annuus]